MLSIIDLVEKNIYSIDAYGAIFNVSWEAPSYLGGLDNVTYRMTKSDYDDDGFNISTKGYFSTKTYLPVDTTVGYYNELTIIVSIFTAQNIDSQFVPSMSVLKKFEEVDLYKAAIGKKLSAINSAFAGYVCYLHICLLVFYIHRFSTTHS